MNDSAEAKSLWLALRLAEQLHIEFNLVMSCTINNISVEGCQCPECTDFQNALKSLQECMAMLDSTGLFAGIEI